MKALSALCCFLVFFYSLIASADTLTCYELFATSQIKTRVKNLLQTKLYSQALVVANEIIKKSPSSPKGYGLKAQAELGLKNFESALQAAQESQRLQSSDANNQVLALQLIASAQEGLGRYEDVIATADQILKTNPKNKVAMAFLSRASNALGQNERAQEAQRFLDKGTFRDLVAKARTYSTQRNHDAAIATLLKALQIDPINRYVIGLLTNSYIQANRLKEALRALDRELELNPQNMVAQGLKIRILLIQKKTLEALSLAEQLSQQDPYKPFYLASALIDLKDYKRALAVLNEVQQPSLDILWKKAQTYYLLSDRLQSRKALIQIIQNAPTVDYRALATLLRMDSEGTGTTDGLGERIVATLNDSQKLTLMDWTAYLEGKNLWEYVPPIPRVVVTKSLVNDFWLGVHNLPVDGQTFRSTK